MALITVLALLFIILIGWQLLALTVGFILTYAWRYISDGMKSLPHAYKRITGHFNGIS